MSWLFIIISPLHFRGFISKIGLSWLVIVEVVNHWRRLLIQIVDLCCFIKRVERSSRCFVIVIPLDWGAFEGHITLKSRFIVVIGVIGRGFIDLQIGLRVLIVPKESLSCRFEVVGPFDRGGLVEGVEFSLFIIGVVIGVWRKFVCQVE